MPGPYALLSRDEISGTAPNPDSATARAGFGKVWDILSYLLFSGDNSGTKAQALTALGAASTASLVNYNNTVVAISTVGASIDWNFDNGPMATLLLNGNKTANAFTNPKNTTYQMLVTNAAATAFTVTSWHASIDWGLAGPPDFGGVNAVTLVTLVSISGTIRGFWTPHK